MTETTKHEMLAPATVATRRIIVIGAGVLAFLGLSMGTLALVFFAVVPSGRLLAPKEFPHPQLESRPHADLQRFLAQQQSQLQVYRWANADHSIVAIPIASAMEIIAQRGTKGYEPIASLPSYNPSPTGGQQ